MAICEVSLPLEGIHQERTAEPGSGWVRNLLLSFCCRGLDSCGCFYCDMQITSESTESFDLHFRLLRKHLKWHLKILLVTLAQELLQLL